MAEPSNGVLLTHIEYIRASVDELKATSQEIAGTVAFHGERLATLEAKDRTPTRKKPRWSTLGGFLGGLIAGFTSSKVGG